jgi:hypothetical protein
MAKRRFTLADQDEALVALIKTAKHKTLARWAIACAERVLPYFVEKYPQDHRPQQALVALQHWIDSGIFSMKAIRTASLSAHASAREVGEDTPARSAARAAGQAVATAHVRTHAIGAAQYALQALSRLGKDDYQTIIAQERVWQYQSLLNFITN